MPRLSRVTAHGTVMFDLACLLNTVSVRITPTPRTSCRLPSRVIAWSRAGIPTWSPRTTTCSTSAISRLCGTFLKLQLPATAFQPSNRRWSSGPLSCQLSRFLWRERMEDIDGGQVSAVTAPSIRAHRGHPERHRPHPGIMSSSMPSPSSLSG